MRLHPVILTFLLVIDDVFAEKVVVAENDRGAEHRQALLEPQQLFSEAPCAGNLPAQPERGREFKSFSSYTAQENLKDTDQISVIRSQFILT